jgi:subtilisin family serine protease
MSSRLPNHVRSTHLRTFHKGNNQARLSHHLRLMLILVLAVLVGVAPVSFVVKARGTIKTSDPETLLAAKADPLLQTIRRSADAYRATTRQSQAGQKKLGELEGARSELEGLSRIAGLERAADGHVNVSLTVSLTAHSAAELKAAGFAVGARLGSIATVETDIERLPELAALASVRKISAATVSYPANDLARAAAGVDNASGMRQVSETGRGVIVGIIDTGIDFRHLDFTVPGTGGQQTRVKALLDMTVYNQQSQPPDPNWNYVLPGASAPIGRLYTEADINAALQLPTSQPQTTDIVKQRDRHGHGTFVAGIAAGNGQSSTPPGKYAGMAPEADLVVAKITRDNNGGGGSNSSDVINAMKFIQQMATEMGKPFVINMSVGTNIGAHDGTMDQERAIDAVVDSGPGRAVCVATGNYGSSDVHASGSLFAGNGLPLGVRVNAGGTPEYLGVSYALADNVTATLTRPDGISFSPVSYNPSQIPGVSNQYVDIYNGLDDKRDADPSNDQKGIVVFFKAAAANLGSSPTRTWTLTLQSGAVNNGHFNAWIEKGNFTGFVDASMRLSSTATSRGATSVGGFVTRSGNREIGDYASFTATGPTADGREKPDISAASYILYSSKSADGTSLTGPQAPDNSSYLGAAGTSASTPVVAGSIALILEKKPQLTNDQIKDLIKTSSTHDSFTGAGWHERFGYGKVNVAAAIQALAPTPTETPALQLSAASYSIGEGAGAATLNVVRSGDASSAATINYATGDTAGLNSCSQTSGKASERCDYATSVGTLRWAAGEGGTKSFTVPITDDQNVEGAEAFTVTLSGATRVPLGSQSAATINIMDNDTNGFAPNPIDDIPFFIRQQYIDFLGRLPDPTGFNNWVATLQGCPDGGYGMNHPTCDRVHVAKSTYQSVEFQTRGYWAYRFYEVAMGRKPNYAEFVPDMAQVGGPKSPQEEALSKDQFINQFVHRSEFTHRYGSLADPAQYVDALLQTAGVPNLSIRSSLISGLQSNQKTREQVLREIVESQEVEDRFYIRGFVSMMYYGFLRRDPDPVGFDNYVLKLNQTGDPRAMTFDFIYSSEYRSRFGQP